MKCKAVRCIYYNAGNGYTVASYVTEETLPKEVSSQKNGRYGMFMAIGNELPTEDGLEVELNGTWKDGKFGRGCISIKSQGFSAPVNKRIKIKNNVFESSDRALEIRDVQNGEISGNQYRNIREAIFVEKETVENVLIAESERKGLL